MMLPPTPVSSNGLTQQWRSTRTFRRGIVRSVKGTEANLIEIGSGAPFSAATITPEGRRPEIGDIWLCSNDTGTYSFLRMLDAASKSDPLRNDLEVYEALTAREAYAWAPFETQAGMIETPMGAFIGERRLFDAAPADGRWIKEDGSAVSRHRYRALNDLYAALGYPYGSGDGVGTFNVANHAGPAGSFACLDYQYIPMTTGDQAVTTSIANLNGLTYTYTIPASPVSNLANVAVDVTAVVAASGVYASAGLPDFEVVLRLDGATWTPSSQSHSIEFQPVSNGFWIQPGAWRVTFGSTGAHTITLAVSKADSTGTINILRKNTSMTCRVMCQDVSGVAAWYVCAE